MLIKIDTKGDDYMKALLITLLLAISSTAFADTILCPTSDNSTSSEPTWNILFRKVDFFEEGYPEYTYRFYHPATKTLDQSRNRPAIIFDSIQFTSTPAVVAYDSTSAMTLICNGKYSGKYTRKGDFWGKLHLDEENIMKAELPVPPIYKTCVKVIDRNGSSFDCTKYQATA
jgi:hypothetical protein